MQPVFPKASPNILVFSQGVNYHNLPEGRKVAKLLQNNLKDLEKCGLYADSITAIGGITNSKIATEIISSALQSEIKVVNGQSAGAVGSCLLAAVGTGYFKTEKEAFAAMKERLK